MITLSNLLYRLPGGVAQGLIWGIMALGIYITFRVLNVSDLTVDGSFTTGGAITIMCILAGINPIIALLISFIVGILTGVVTGLIHTKLKIPAILAGILVQFGLYSINLHIMNMSANVSANPDRFNLLISMRDVPNAILIGIILSIVHIIVLYWYFGTEQGSAIRATGNNNNMALAQGININNMKVIGFGIGNGIVALAGGLMAQYQGFADINMGRGAIVIGLAAIIIGEVVINFIFKKGCSFYTRLASVIIGGIIYYAAMVFILWLRIDSNDLKLFTAIIVTIFLAIPNLNIKKGENKMLKIENISKTFNPGTIHQKAALSNLSLQLEEGDFVTVIGSNGAGKSTLLNAISGTWFVDEGKISVDDIDVTLMSEHQRAKYIGRVFQDPLMGTAADMWIEENLALANRRGKFRGLKIGITRKEREFYYEKLKALNLGLEERLTTKVGLLSGGQRQALTLLMATLQKPKLLLLDEHTAALDPSTATKVLDLTDQLVNENNLTTLMITHNMQDAIDHGNRLIMMNDGVIILDVKGKEKASLTKEDLIKKFNELSNGTLDNDSLLLSK